MEKKSVISGVGADRHLVWDGIVNDRLLIDTTDIGAFISTKWLDTSLAHLTKFRENKDLPPARASDLPLVYALSGSTSIIDFGGSSGWTYEYLKRSFRGKKKLLNYTIFELPELSDYYQKIGTHATPVKYITNDSEITRHDILYSNSMIQYILDDDILPSWIIAAQPNLILIDNFLGGEFEDYYSYQLYYDYRIPVKFRNQSQFVTRLRDLGFSLLVEKIYAEPIRGQILELEMGNFPENLRIKYGKTLMFSRYK